MEKRDWFDPAFVAERQAERAAQVAKEQKVAKFVAKVAEVFKKGKVAVA